MMINKLQETIQYKRKMLAENWQEEINKTMKNLLPGWQRSSESDAGMPTIHPQRVMPHNEQNGSLNIMFYEEAMNLKRW